MTRFSHLFSLAAGLACILAAGTAQGQCCGCQGSCTVGTQTYDCDYTCNNTGCAFGNLSNTDCASNCNDGLCVLCTNTLTSGAAIEVRATSGDDIICVKDVPGAGTAPSVIVAKGGHDLIQTGSGADDISASSGADTIYAGGGNDTIDGYTGNDEIYGEGGSDEITAGSNDDTVYGGDGDDTIDGAQYADYLDGGTGDDVITGGTGDDTLVGGGNRDVLQGGDGNDVISSNAAAAAAEDDVLGAILCGGKGNDTIRGWGPSHQCMDGGDGTDSCNHDFGPSSRASTAFDVGTGRACEPANGDNIAGSTVPCSCP